MNAPVLSVEQKVGIQTTQEGKKPDSNTKKTVLVELVSITLVCQQQKTRVCHQSNF